MFKKLPFPFLFLISLLVFPLTTFATTGVSPGAGTTNLPSPESIGMGEDLFDNIRVNKNINDLPVNPCIPSVLYPCAMYLTNVTIGTINNNSGCDGSYSDFSAQSTVMEIGSTQSISFSAFNYDQYVSVYIDINDNDQMTDYGELVVNNMFVGAGSTNSTSFTLPAHAVPGSYIMRVISTYYYDGFLSSPCGQTNYGEAEDYTLIVTCATTPLTFNNDADGDGFGDPATSESALCPSTGFVFDNTDCDDTDTGVNPATTEISENMIDDDCDGEIDELLYCIPSIYGSCSQSSISIYQIAMGTIDNASTCNTTGYEDFTSLSTTIAAGQDISFSATLNFLAFTYSGFGAFIDFNQDGDFYDSGEFVFTSIVYSENNVTSGTITIPFAIPPGNYTIRLTADPTQYYDPCYSSYGEVEDYTLTITCPISPVTYYADADGDGFGDPNASISETGCAPAGYVFDNTDCDDSNATYHELIYWYLDADGDGYYSDYMYTCVPPEGEGWTTQQPYGQDCDDTNADYIYYQYWYLDADGDGYYSNYSYSCAPPVGEGWTYYSLGDDCDDSNADYYYYTYWYYDGDGDGYHSDYISTCIPPEGEGWSVQTLGADCDDANTDLNQNLDWYLDGDGDGYHSDYIYTCITPEGEGWSNQSYGDDCDDTNAAINQNLDWFFDGDGDGYASEHIYTCITPEGEGWSNQSSGSDCDDTNAALTYSISWFYDGDGDGYYSDYIYTCIPPEGEGWITQYYGYDCDDTNPSYQVGFNYFLDADGDGYYSEVVYACFLPEGTGWSEYYSYGDGDCDDSNAAIHPGPETLGNEIDDNCDGLIDVLVYCTPSGYTDCNYNANITNVELGTMSNASGCSSGYDDYSQFVVSANAGDEITYSVSISPNYAVLEIYIDYNLNGLFNDQGELVVYDYNYQYLVPFTGTIALPSGLAYGSYRIRIKADYGYYYNYPCIYHYGEIEDYTINIGTVCADIDLDGYTDQACGGNDCDDNNNAINPAATEICNGDIDDNCNGTADDTDNTVTGQGTWYADGDGDGYGAGAAIFACTAPANTVSNNEDCDDNAAAVNPAAQEICNAGIDDDCDGTADDADNTVTGQGTYYADGDADGYGAGDAILACSAPANTVSNNEDCDDNDNAVNPAAQEICNAGIDDDCDGSADDADNTVTGQGTYYADGDNDGYGAGDAILACTAPANTVSNNEDCDDNDNAVNPAAQEICNAGIDDDCDGNADDADDTVTGQGTYYADGDNDGYGGDVITACIQPIETITTGGDCNDASTDIHPGAPEVCNSIDEDCDGDIDEGVQISFYADNDGDGYGAGAAILACTAPANTVSNNEDCDDNDNAVNPAAQEICNGGTDDDCDGSSDDADASTTGQNTYYTDADGDGYGAGAPVLACPQPVNTSVNNTDCNDAATTVYPGATELCNSVDDDCDGILNEGYPTTTYYRDFDGDGLGNPAVTIQSCYQPAGYVTNANDCDDNSATACPKPSAMSTTNITDVTATVNWSNLPCAFQYRLEYRRRSGASPIENNWTVVYSNTPTFTLTGLVPGGILYQWRVATICTPGVTAAQSGYATPLQTFYTRYRVYTDSDGDNFGAAGVAPSYVLPFPQPGYALTATDCDDAAATTYPGAPELCNGIDDDCDLIVDEGANWYQDADGDGLGNAAVSLNACLQPSGYVANSVDCNDNSTTPVCATPANVTATGIGASFVTINWTTSPCASGYTVMYRIAPSGAFSTQFNTTGSSMMLSGLLPVTTYQARVRAKCPAPNTVTTSNWVYVTFTTNGTGLIEQVDEDINTLDPVTFGVYPNPGDGRFTLSIPGDTDGEADISVLDGFGKLVHTVRWSVYEGITVNELDLTHLPGGVYHINIRKGDMMQTKKVVIVR
jgi:hypothetical protein